MQQLQQMDHRDQRRTAVHQGARNRELLFFDLRVDVFQLLQPYRHLVALQRIARILQKQGFNIGNVAQDQFIRRHPAQRHLCLRHQIGETPCEFLEGRRIAGGRQRIGGARGDFGNPREIADAVVAGGNFRIPQMEQVQLVEPAGARRFRVHPHHQIGIPLGIDDDHDLAAMDILRHQNFHQAGLADARGAENNHVPIAVPLAQQHLHFIHLDAVQDGGAAKIDLLAVRIHRIGADRIPPRLLRGDVGDRLRHRPLVRPAFKPARTRNPWTRFRVAPGFIPHRIHFSLGMQLRPAESLAEIQIIARHRNFMRRDFAQLVALQAALVA